MSLLNPLTPIVLAGRYRDLLLPLVRRKISARYRGSGLGASWAVLNPLIMLGIYTFIFSVILQSKWGIDSSSRPEFALFLFSGLILYSVFSECVSEVPSVLLENRLYIQQLVFPTELLAWGSVLATLFNLLINWVILILFYSWVVGVPSPALLYFPVIVLPVVLITLGSVWIISSVGLYLRDTTSRAANFDYVLGLGADVAIDYTVDDYRSVIRSQEPEGVDLVLEALLGEGVAEDAIRLVKTGGAVAYMNNEPPEMADIAERNIKAEFLHHRPDGAMLQNLVALFEQGVLKIPEIDVMPLTEAVAAHHRSESGRTRGKVVLHVQDL